MSELEKLRTRSEAVSVVEAYFDAFTSRGAKAPPITQSYAASSILAGQMAGTQATEYFRAAGQNVDRVWLREHIVEGNRVVTLLTEYSGDEEIDVLAVFKLEGALVARVDVWYDPRVFVG